MDKTIDPKKFLTIREAQEMLKKHQIRRSLSWFKIQIYAKKIRSEKFASSRLVYREDIESLAKK